MDIFAHGLWANAIFYKKYQTDWKNRWWAIAFGVLPDLVSFSPLFIYAFLARSQFWDLVSKNAWVARYASESYNYTHSAILFTLIFVIVLLIRRGKVWWPMFGWALHIVIDIFTHKGFYETPFLFPISGYRFDHGVQWGEHWFMALNYGLMIVVYLLFFIIFRNRKSTS